MNAPENRLHDEATMIAADAAVAKRARPTHVRDVVSYLSCCSDTFGRLAAIFSSIERQAEDQSASEIVKLAQVGDYIASDFENEIDATRERVAGRGVTAQDSVDEIVSEAKMSVEALDQIRAVLDAIAKEVDRMRCRPHLKSLANAGNYIAGDFENTLGCWADEIETNGMRSD